MSEDSSVSPAVPQLRMGFTRFDSLLPPRMPPGYQLRAFRPGDEEAWIAILNTGNFGAWDRARLDQMLAGERAPLPRDGIFFATRDDRPVATVCVFLHASDSGVMPELGWVAVAPEHRGHGLSRELGRAALLYVRDHGYRYIYLLTEDYRPAAIKTYLRLGFEPEMIDPAHPAWWAEAVPRLGGQGMSRE